MKWKEEKAKYEAESKKVERFVANFKAKKNFTISQNDYHREIKAGEDVSDVPVQYHENLKTEGII